MKKPFYIVPNTTGYHEVIDAETSEDALVTFAENMDTDMSAYFAATDKEPVKYPHRYDNPKGRFERAMTVIVDTVSEKTDSPYYMGGRLGLNLNCVDAAAKLQMVYDNIKAVEPGKAKKVNKTFCRLLGKLTRFRLQGRKITEVSLKPGSKEEKTELEKILDIFRRDATYDSNDEAMFRSNNPLFKAKMEELLEEKADFEDPLEWEAHVKVRVTEILNLCQYGDTSDADDLEKIRKDLETRGLGERYRM